MPGFTVFVWQFTFKFFTLSLVPNESPDFIHSLCFQSIHTQGQGWSQALNKVVCVQTHGDVGAGVLHTETVNNKPTQDQTGPQLNQSEVQHLLPLSECACACVFTHACRRIPSLDQSTESRGWQNNDLSFVLISLHAFLHPLHGPVHPDFC